MSLNNDRAEIVHPYLDVINSFEYQKEQLTITPMPPIKTLKETPVYVISNRNSLLKLLSTLRNCKEIAVDVIHMTINYKKNVLYLLISTCDADYIFDIAKVRHELLLLNEIFINPKIVKILGFKEARVLAYLQQGLCLYAVNTFDLVGAMRKSADLAQATLRKMDLVLKEDYNEEISYEKFPVGMNKVPLSKEAEQHCRVKTHYFIHMYHVYKNNLINADEKAYLTLLEEWRQNSKLVYLEKSEEELDSLESALKQRHKAELVLLKMMFAWRKNTAREINAVSKDIIDKDVLLSFASYIPCSVAQIKSFTKCELIKKDANEINNVIRQLTRHFAPVFSKTCLPIFSSPNNDGMGKQTEKRKAKNQGQPAPAKKPKIKQRIQTRSHTQAQSQETSNLHKDYIQFLQTLDAGSQKSSPYKQEYNQPTPNLPKPPPFVNMSNQQISPFITIPNPQLQMSPFAVPNFPNLFLNHNQGAASSFYSQANNHGNQFYNEYKPHQDDTTKPGFYKEDYNDSYNRNEKHLTFPGENSKSGNMIHPKSSFSPPRSDNFTANSPDFYGGNASAYAFSQNQNNFRGGGSGNSSNFSNNFDEDFNRNSNYQGKIHSRGDDCSRNSNHENLRDEHCDGFDVDKRGSPKKDQRKNSGLRWRH